MTQGLISIECKPLFPASVNGGLLLWETLCWVLFEGKAEERAGFNGPCSVHPRHALPQRNGTCHLRVCNIERPKMAGFTLVSPETGPKKATLKNTHSPSPPVNEQNQNNLKVNTHAKNNEALH